MKGKFITSGFPRSGSTYLNQALNLLYYPEQKVNWNRHTVIAIEQANQIMVPFRNPTDSIASWHKYPSRSEIAADIAFYIRFYSAVLNDLNKVVLMNFYQFTKDLDYIKDKVFKNFGIDTNRVVTDEQVRQAMLFNGKDINLPRNNKEELDAAKIEIINAEKYNQCLELYAELIEAHNKQ